MNQLFLLLGIESWKPVLTGLLLPPLPLFLLLLIGARVLIRWRAWGWCLILLSLAGLWLSSSSAVAMWLQREWTQAPPALSASELTDLRRASAAQRGAVVIVVLGAGREQFAPEYGVASLNPASLERLRYGLWLARETGAPVLFSGGLGHAAGPAAAEAEIAAEVAAKEFGRALRWTEARSRDTRENAAFTSSMLRDQGVQTLVLVTHGWHQPRALRAFRDAARQQQAAWRIVPAPMGLADPNDRPVLRWMPSSDGFRLVRAIVREKMGLLLGA